MRKSLSPKDIACRKSDCLAWGDAWSDAFGSPEIGSTWFISGPSASGKSTFVMQMARELCNLGTVLYLSYEEGIGLSFRQQIGRAHV